MHSPAAVPAGPDLTSSPYARLLCRDSPSARRSREPAPKRTNESPTSRSGASTAFRRRNGGTESPKARTGRTSRPQSCKSPSAVPLPIPPHPSPSTHALLQSFSSNPSSARSLPLCQFSPLRPSSFFRLPKTSGSFLNVLCFSWKTSFENVRQCFCFYLQSSLLSVASLYSRLLLRCGLHKMLCVLDVVHRGMCCTAVQLPSFDFDIGGAGFANTYPTRTAMLLACATSRTAHQTCIDCCGLLLCWLNISPIL